jgi:hypothetical protein
MQFSFPYLFLPDMKQAEVNPPDNDADIIELQATKKDFVTS